MNEVSCSCVKVNWKGIINNATNKKFWGSRMLILKIDNAEYYLIPYAIDLINNKIELMVDSKIQSAYFRIPMDESHYNENVFNASLSSALTTIVEKEEARKIEFLSVYKNARQLDDRIDEINEEYIKNYLDEHRVTDPKIREYVIDCYLDDNSGYNAMSVLRKLKYYLKTKTYMYIAILFNRESLLNEIHDVIKRQGGVEKEYQITLGENIKEELEELERMVDEDEYEYGDIDFDF